jgi:hypothetical protein
MKTIQTRRLASAEVLQETLAGNPNMIILVIRDYNVILETRDADLALDLYEELVVKNEGKDVQVDLSVVIERNGGEGNT